MALNTLLEGLKGNLNLSVLRLDGVEWRDLRFPNEESYRGGWKDSRVSCPKLRGSPPNRRNEGGTFLPRACCSVCSPLGECCGKPLCSCGVPWRVRQRSCVRAVCPLAPPSSEPLSR